MKNTIMMACPLLLTWLLISACCFDSRYQVMAFSSVITQRHRYASSFLNSYNNNRRRKTNNNNNNYASSKRKNNSYNDDDPFGDNYDPFGDYDDGDMNQNYNDNSIDDNDDDDNDDFNYVFYDDDDDDDDDDNDSYGNSNYDNQKNRNRKQESPSRGGRNKREVGMSQTEQKQQQQQTHFFSKKSLLDPSFVYNDGDGGNSLQEELCEEAGIVKPSRIQALTWPLLVKGEDAIIADQTGSGKTLAYLLPLLQRSLSKVDIEKKKAAPRILILAPTAELADQIDLVCRSKFAHRFSTAVITAQGKYATDIYNQIRMLRTKSFHVLISTPGRISTILRSKDSGGLDLSHVQSVVLDEVDVLLMDDTFGPQLRTIGSALAPSSNGSTSNKEKTQFVFVTATLPDTVVDSVKAEFNTVQVVKGPGLHRVAPTVKESLVDVSVSDNRNLNLGFEKKAHELQLALRQTSCRRTLVFCNTVETCRKVENLLRRKDRNFRLTHVSSYHNAMSPEARRKSITSFSHGNVTNKFKNNDKKKKQSRGGNDDDNDNVNYVLICTDRAARGVDFDESPVDHVILFDFPKDPAEYVRRVGRTARAGRSGKTTVFAYGWQLPIARKIMGFSKLDTISSTFSDDQKDKSDDDEYTARDRQQHIRSKQKQQRKTKNNKNKMIRNNIQSGKDWS